VKIHKTNELRAGSALMVKIAGCICRPDVVKTTNPGFGSLVLRLS